MTVGQNIRRLRLAAGLSQKQLADKIGKSRPLISQYEADVIQPRMGTVEKLARALACKKSDIIETDGGLNIDDMERELISMFRKLNAHDKKVILSLAASLSPGSLDRDGRDAFEWAS